MFEKAPNTDPNRDQLITDKLTECPLPRLFNESEVFAAKDCFPPILQVDGGDSVVAYAIGINRTRWFDPTYFYPL